MVAGTTLKLKQQRSRDRRQQILSAATKLFGEKGIDRTSLTEIAATAKVPLSSIYDYFEDKRALVLEVPEENFAALYDKTEPLLVKGGADPIEQLRITYLSNFEYIRENPSWGRVFFLEIWPSVTAAEPRIKKSVDRYALRYVQLIKQAIRSGVYRKNLDPYLAMSLLMGGMCHVTAVWLLYGRKYDLLKKGRAVFATLHEGFLNQ
ncbi:TetR/AcrR family transcriptional regulator [Bradyrhizobium cenepequi]|uniref:TetR/AcrR family transcriptional regulator n=1 Tax=Bradyrhizobium cenepequi TaxID=2821403 RepID=UPI001CE29DD7|nr:TetR/AcrR family transcriptional regulator [Bradyrhizobium cenepequi]MCA6112670.1 TetR/AcrR family transcriptional regulator [Bradyrhizobium cenepequi]